MADGKKTGNAWRWHAVHAQWLEALAADVRKASLGNGTISAPILADLLLERARIVGGNAKMLGDT